MTGSLDSRPRPGEARGPAPGNPRARDPRSSPACLPGGRRPRNRVLLAATGGRATPRTPAWPRPPSGQAQGAEWGWRGARAAGPRRGRAPGRPGGAHPAAHSGPPPCTVPGPAPEAAATAAPPPPSPRPAIPTPPHSQDSDFQLLKLGLTPYLRQNRHC